MLFAAIDIGSNAVRLLFSNVYEVRPGRVVAEKATLMRIPIRLGMDVYSQKRVSDHRAEDLLTTLKAFKMLIAVYRPQGYKACATAAMREAENGEEILLRITKEAGITVRIIDGLEEARIISGASNLNLNTGVRGIVYVDVGGGSTEVSVYDGGRCVDAWSFSIGTLRMLHGKVEEAEWEKMKAWLGRWQDKGWQVIGSGGNINKLAKLYGAGYQQITFSELSDGYTRMKKMTVEERISTMGLRPDRADVIVPAARVFLKVLKWLGEKVVYTPRIGLADGLVIEQYTTYMQSSQ